MRKVPINLIFTLAFVFTADVLWASSTFNGTLTAAQSCEAYASKNKRTNPDNTKLVIDQNYTIFEANKADNPTWYRIRMTNANPADRWVEKRCGTINVQAGDDSDSSRETVGETNNCNTSGLADSYVLALNWQPAFCETHRNKPECRVEDKNSYQARNFTLHGLWPNKKSCGTHYEYCGEVLDKPGDFCDYPMLSLFNETRQSLNQVMPSAAAGSCLQRHEWFKHGTCQTSWSIDEYYEIAVDLTKQFNESGIAYFISRNIGSIITEAEFISKIDCLHGAGAHQQVELKCQQDGTLVDVYINLPTDITYNINLTDLMIQGESQFKSNCNGSFTVDEIGF